MARKDSQSQNPTTSEEEQLPVVAVSSDLPSVEEEKSPPDIARPMIEVLINDVPTMVPIQTIDIVNEAMAAKDAIKQDKRRKEPWLPQIEIQYIPGPGHPHGKPVQIGHPFNLVLPTNEWMLADGRLAKLLAIQFPKRIFRKNSNGEPTKFHVDSPKNGTQGSISK